MLIATMLLVGSLTHSGGIDLSPLPSPAPTNARFPSLVAGADDELYLCWTESVEAGSRLCFARRTPTGWSAPREVAAGAAWFVNWADFPSMAALSDGSLMAHWLDRLGEGTYAYGVRFALSTDAGASWSEPRWLHEDRAEVEHGFCSLVALDEDRFGALWLDGRQNATGGPMALYWRTVARDGTLGEEECVDARVCDCCQTTLALDAAGAPLAAWRDRGDTQERRDISWARRADDGWSAPRPVHTDGWIIEGCPVNGPRLVGGAAPAVAWYSGAEGDTRVSFAALDAGGASFAAPEQLIGAESFGRLDLVRLGDGDWLASWLEHDDGSQATWSLARFPTSAIVQTRTVVAHVPSARSSGSLRMARGANEVLLAWTSPGPEAGIAVATLELQDTTPR